MLLHQITRLLWQPKGRGAVVGDGAFGFRIVGTSYHRDLIERLVGERTRRSLNRYCGAELLPQAKNSNDYRAIVVAIHGMEVGYFDRVDALNFGRALHASGYADAACEAELVGGWVKGEDWGYVGVRLNASLPFRLQAASEYWSARRRDAGSPSRPKR